MVCGIGRSRAESLPTQLNLLFPTAIGVIYGCGGAYLRNIVADNPTDSLQPNALDQFVKARVVAQRIKTRLNLKISDPQFVPLIGFLQILKRFILIANLW